MTNTKQSATSRPDWVTLCALSALVLLPIWIVHFPAAADYWNHLFKAKIVADYADPALGYSRFYEISFLPIPNMASTLIMALLMKLAPPMTAGKVFLSLYALALPLSARYLVRSAKVPFLPLEYIGFALVYNPCLWDGYIDSCLSVAFGLLAIGYWLRMRDRVTPANAMCYVALALATYFTHLWGFAVLVAVTALLALGEAASKRLLWLGLGLIGAALLAVYSHGTSERLSIDYFGLTYTLSLARNFLSLPRLAGLPADPAHFSSVALLITVRLALAVALIAVAWKQKNRLFWIALALTVSFFLLPNQLGRMREPGQRTLIFAPVLLAAAASVYPNRRQGRVLSFLLFGCIGLGIVFTARSWIAKDRDLSVYHQALMRIPAQRRVLNVVTLQLPTLEWPWKVLGSDTYRSENFFGANYNIEKGGLYLHTFTTGIIKVREGAAPLRPWFIMDKSFSWPVWLERNYELVEGNFDYVVVVGPRDRVARTLRRGFAPCWRGDGVEVLRRVRLQRETKD